MTRRRSFRPPLGLVHGQEGGVDRRHCSQRRLRPPHRPLPVLLHLPPPPPPYGLQLRRHWPLRLRPLHRARRTFHQRLGRNVHILLLLPGPRPPFPCRLSRSLLAYPLRYHLPSFYHLPRRHPPFHFRVPKMVSRQKEDDRSHAGHEGDSQSQRSRSSE